MTAQIAKKPHQIAEQMITEQGPDGALSAVRAEIEAAHHDGDNYRLSIWREVRRSIPDLAENDASC